MIGFSSINKSLIVIFWIFHKSIFVYMKMVVLLDNGHGSNCIGKCSPDALKGLKDSPYYFREYQWCREIARDVMNVLYVRGIDAYLLVQEEEDISLQERTRRVNAYCSKYGRNNVILVSIHNNAAGDAGRWMTARGWSIYTTKGLTESDILADYIMQEAIKEFQSPLKVRKYIDKYLERDYEENFYIIKNTQCPAVLVENFFQDNKEDVLYLKSGLGKGSCIHVLSVGIENYLKSKGQKMI